MIACEDSRRNTGGWPCTLNVMALGTILAISRLSPRYPGLLHNADESSRFRAQELGWKRSDVVLSTKIFWGGKGPNDKGLSRKHIIEGCKVRAHIAETAEPLHCLFQDMMGSRV